MEEIRKSGLTFQEAKNLVDISIRDVKDGFVATGYYLWIIREERLWEDDGYNSFHEFLHCQYQKDKSWASRCIGLYEQFGKQIEFGQLPVLAAPYRDYSVSQLIEMVSMTEEQREQVTPEMKVREIREMKPKREKKAAKAPEGEVLAEDSGTKPERQIPEQSELSENAETVATVATIVKADGAKKGDASGKCADREEFYSSLTEAQGKEKDGEPLSAYGTPRIVYPEDSLIATAGCQGVDGGLKGSHNCFSCARECQIRQEFCYCVEAPLGNPFPCDRIDEIGMLRDAVGDKCQFVNLFLAYHRQGDGEPVPCCKACGRQCDFRCDRAKLKTEPREKGQQIEGEELEAGAKEPATRTDEPKTEEKELETGAKAAKVKTYDRNILGKMIAEAENALDLMREYWIENQPREYTKQVMTLQAYKNLMMEQDAAEAEQLKNREPEQPELLAMKNNDQRKAWLKNYKAWGLWYRDEHIDVNYYKYDFEDGSRLIVAEFPQREHIWTDEKYDQVYYHLIECGKRKYRSDKVYEDKYQYHSNSETELVEYLKKIQKKKG